MRRKPSVLLLSMLVHAAALALITAAPWWSPIPDWPMPREVLAFSEAPRVAQLQDIELPRPAQSGAPMRRASAAAEVPELAPVVASTGINPETEREGSAGEAAASAIETGAAGVEGIGAAAAPPPPPEPRPQEPVRAGGLVRPPTKLVSVSPRYPALARASHVQGVVIIEAVIDRLGNVESTVVLRSIPLLDQAALDAVRQWTFTPTLLNGVAVPVVMTVTVNFDLSQ